MYNIYTITIRDEQKMSNRFRLVRLIEMLMKNVAFVIMLWTDYGMLWWVMGK